MNTHNANKRGILADTYLIQCSKKMEWNSFTITDGYSNPYKMFEQQKKSKSKGEKQNLCIETQWANVPLDIVR
jgi:hypothetical protein